MNLSHAVAVVLSQLFDIQQQRLMLLEERQADGDGSGGGDGSSRPAAGGDGGAGWLQDLDAAGLSGSLFEDSALSSAACLQRHTLCMCIVLCTKKPRACSSSLAAYRAGAVAAGAGPCRRQPGGAGSAAAAGGGAAGGRRHQVRWPRRHGVIWDAVEWCPMRQLTRRAGAAACCSAKESMGGGDKSNHGRRKLLMGHIRCRGVQG